MTRRQKRFEKRNAMRVLKKQAFYQKYDDFNIVMDRGNLFRAADQAKKGVMWKASVQNWSIHQLLNTEKLFRDLQKGKDVRKGFSKFIIYERGKIRQISAVKFYERVVQKTLCQNILYPVYTRSLIYDNAASQDNKGVDFALNRLTTHLRRYFRKFGSSGYALLIDFKGYFGNINHGVLKRLYRAVLKNKPLLRLVDGFVDSYGENGLGLGSETSQMHAIAFPNKIDHKITELKFGKIFYGRYMDDSYVLANSKNVLIQILGKIKEICADLKIVLSPKKTVIVPFKNGIKWLKTKYYLLKTGKIIRKPCRESVVRQRKKLKKQLKMFENGVLGAASIKQSFESWAGSMKRRHARLSVWKMRQILWSEKL